MAYNVSEKYKELIYSGDNDNELYLEYDGVEVKDAPLKTEYLEWRRRILNNGSKTLKLDNFVSQTIEFAIRDYEVSDTTKEFYIKIGSMVDGAYEYVPLGYYHIKNNPSTANGKTTYKLTDRSTNFDKYIDISEFIKSHGGKITKLQAVQEYCRQCGVEFANTSFLGSNEEIAVYDNTITVREHITYFAECSGCIATIGRDGKLYFIPLVKPNMNNTHVIPERILNNNMNNSKGSFRISKVVWEGALTPFEKGDNTGDTLFLNTSNPYISKQEDIDRIYNQVVGLEIDNISTSSIMGDVSIDPWDYIVYTHTDDNGNERESFTSLAQYDLEFDGVFKQTFDTSIDREKKKINSTKNSQTAKTNRLKQEIDNVNNTLKVTAEKVDGNTTKIGQLEISNGKISSKVSTIEKDVSDTKSDLEQTNKNVSALDTKINGVSADFTDFKDNEYVQSIGNLQDQIDGAIQFWNGKDIPTINNYPANEWTTEADKNNHRADIYTVIDDSSTPPKQGKSYRFDKVDGVWKWVELTDNELSAVQKLAQDALDKANNNEKNIGTLTEKTSTLEQTDDRIEASVAEINNNITTSKTSTGNPIEITDAGEYPLESIEIDGKSKQEVSIASKNKLDLNRIKKGFINSSTGEIETNSSYPNAHYSDYIYVPKNSTAYLLNNSTASRIRIYNNDKSYKGLATDYIKYTSTDNCYIRILWLDTINGQPMVKIDDNSVEYEPFVPNSPSPEYPSEIKTVKGVENLLNPSGYTPQNTNKYSTKFEVNRLNATAIADLTGGIFFASYTYQCKKNTNYTLSVGDWDLNGRKRASIYIYKDRLWGTLIASKSLNKNDSFVFNSGDNTSFIIGFYNDTATAKGTNIFIEDIQLEEGSIAHDYVPYGTWLQQITKDKNGNINTALIDMNIYDENNNIISNHELAQIGDIKDTFENGVLTKRIGKVVLDGSENWEMNFGTGMFHIANLFKVKDVNSRTAMCTHFVYNSVNSGIYGTLKDDEFAIQYDNNGTKIFFKDLNRTTVDDFKSWLKEQYNAGTPVIVYYILAEPKTYQLKYEQLKLFKGYNYITLNDELLPNMNVEYLTDSKFNSQYATKAQLEIESNRISSEVNGKFSDYSTTTEMNNTITQKVTESENSTKSELTTTFNNKLKDYPTTTTMNNTIEQKVTESENSINLSVSQKIDNIQVGGTNLITGGSEYIAPTVGSTAQWGKLRRKVSVTTGETYTLSMYYNEEKRTDFTKGYAYAYAYKSDGTIAVTGDYMVSSNTTRTKTIDNSEIAYLIIHIGIKNCTQGDSYKVKFEKGNKSTDWSPAPEDMATNKDVNAKFELKVGKNDYDQIISMINQAADEITLAGGSKINITTAGKLLISAGNFQLNEEGNVVANNAKLNDVTMDDVTMSRAVVTNSFFQVLSQSGFPLSYFTLGSDDGTKTLDFTKPYTFMMNDNVEYGDGNGNQTTVSSEMLKIQDADNNSATYYSYSQDFIRTTLSSQYKLTSTNTWEILPVNKNVLSKGNTFYAGTNAIGINRACTIEVSASAYYFTGTNGGKTLQISKNGGVVARCGIKATGNYMHVNIPPIPLEVSDGDIISLEFSGTSGDTIQNYAHGTWLYAKVIA